jgi:transposase
LSFPYNHLYLFYYLHRLFQFFLQRDIEAISKLFKHSSDEIDERLKEEQEIIELIDELPGIGKRSAEYIISEIGTDMSRFPTANHLCSWAGLCPGKKIGIPWLFDY